jgi:hypothetical protein
MSFKIEYKFKGNKIFYRAALCAMSSLIFYMLASKVSMLAFGWK